MLKEERERLVRRSSKLQKKWAASAITDLNNYVEQLLELNRKLVPFASRFNIRRVNETTFDLSPKSKDETITLRLDCPNKLTVSTKNCLNKR